MPLFSRKRSRSAASILTAPPPVAPLAEAGSRAAARRADYVHDMDAPLLQLSPAKEDSWCLRDALEGVQIFGGIGSGKTSGSGRALAHAFLRSGMGGVVLCAKPDEAANWMSYAKETGRERSILRFDASGAIRFNFLEYEMSRNPGAADIMSANVVACLQNILEVAARGTTLSTPAAGDAFWQKAPRMMLGYGVDLLYATWGRVRLAELMDLIESAPTSPAQMKDAEWREHSFFYQTFSEFFATGGGVYPPPPEDLVRLKKFWTSGFPRMAEKTRSNIITTLTADLDPLLRGRMRTIFSTETNIVPELTHEGAVILLDFPVKEFNEAGILAQQIFKYLWQRATERRAVSDATRPVFLWSDECQFFLSGYDMEFQSTARSSRACTVLMTQNLPTLYSKIGGQVPEHTVNALIGNLRTKILHSNTDNATNQWAAQLIGRETVWRANYSSNEGWSSGDSRGWNSGDSTSWQVGGSRGADGTVSVTSSSGGGFSQGVNQSWSRGRSGGTSQGVQEQLDHAIQPEEFGRSFKTGGRRSGYKVSGVVMQAGRRFASGRNWLRVEFDQRS